MKIWKVEKKANMKSGMGKYRWMNRLPLVGRLQRCSRISLFCLHSHRTPQGRSTLNLFWGIFLEEFPEKSFSWRNSWKRVFLEEFLEKDIFIKWCTFPGEWLAGLRDHGPYQVGKTQIKYLKINKKFWIFDKRQPNQIRNWQPKTKKCEKLNAENVFVRHAN